MKAEADYLTKLLSDAAEQYPFVKQHNPVVVMGQRDGDYAETWWKGDEGDSQYPRPQDIPMDRVGVEVFKPNAFGPSDLAAEMLHVDPIANGTRQQLLNSLSPQQIATLKRASADYKQSIDMGMPEDKAMNNAVDSAMRGYTVGQWPQSANDQMGYTPQQQRQLDSLKSYMTTGVYPSAFNLAFVK